MVTRKQQDKVDDYLRGKLSEKEEKRFLKECKYNKDLKEYAYAIAMMCKAMRRIMEENV